MFKTYFSKLHYAFIATFTFGSTAVFADTPYSTISEIKAAEAAMPFLEKVFHMVFSARYFEPHRLHFLEDIGLMWTLVAANIITFIAYTLIPVALVILIRKRKSLIYGKIFWLFGAFIVLCGLHHIVHVVTFWYPLYYLQAIVDSVMSVVSIFTAAALIPILPKAINLRDPEELEALNAELQSQITSRQDAEDALRKNQENLMSKNQELESTLDELSKKNKEMERINKTMLDREIKMAELKKRIKELESPDKN